KLTGEHVTDATNASRTLLYDIGAARWDEELLELFGVPGRALPRVLPSAGSFGVTRPQALHGHAVPVCGVAGDQQAALFGHACVETGMGKNTYGTGSFVLVNAGAQAPAAPRGLLATVACSIGAERAYALEAAIFVTGAAVQWLRDGLGIIERAQDTEQLARELDDNGGVYFVPALTGLGSPHWDAHARGTIVGLTRGSTRAHLARAALEAIAYQTVDAVRAIEQATGEPLRELRADGGASTNAWLMQFQADVLGVPVVLGRMPQTTALGAAYLAGVGAGLWTLADVRDGPGLGDTASSVGERPRRYLPALGEDERAALLAGWSDALERARS
ncbi:MAG: glycerol kinase, partial [Solirubrobacteraceae bacterium]|nr:glycerol kinase [Solirubrobacteraceae bacterium]